VVFEDLAAEVMAQLLTARRREVLALLDEVRRIRTGG
jgi:hypothetical protein